MVTWKITSSSGCRLTRIGVSWAGALETYLSPYTLETYLLERRPSSSTRKEATPAGRHQDAHPATKSALLAPIQAARVTAWVRCFLQLNKSWLIQLTKRVRTALGTLPEEELGTNGEHFFKTCFSDTALTYGFIQVMKAGERYDP